MKTLKQLAWTVPAAALLVGTIALATGFSGVSTGSSLPTPVEGAVAGQQAAGSGAVDGANWTPMFLTASVRGI